jgi:hypothetical protein
MSLVGVFLIDLWYRQITSIDIGEPQSVKITVNTTHTAMLMLMMMMMIIILIIVVG